MYASGVCEVFVNIKEKIPIGDGNWISHESL